MPRLFNEMNVSECGYATESNIIVGFAYSYSDGSKVNPQSVSEKGSVRGKCPSRNPFLLLPLSCGSAAAEWQKKDFARGICPSCSPFQTVSKICVLLVIG